MCARYATEKLDQEYIKFMREVMKAAPPKLEPRYNIALSQHAPVLRMYDGEPQWADLRWQLYEAWWSKIERGRQHNARGETVFTNGMFKHSAQKRRCLVLATGWYEWPKKPKKGRPHFIHMKDSRPVMFAGIWSTYHSDEKKVHEDNFAIITTEAPEKIKYFHDRQPVIISPKDYTKWLDPENHDLDWLQKRLAPYKGRDLEEYEVSDYVGSVRHQGEECIKPLDS